MTSALLVLLLCSPAAGPKGPVTGECARGFESLDGVITTHMTNIGATAGSLTLAKDGKVVVTRGYGWADKKKTRPSGLEIEMRDAYGGLTSSTPALCAFLKEFWITGERRTSRRGRSLTQTGSHTKSTTAILSHRSNGFDYAILFNARRKDRYKEDTKALRKVINEFLEDK